MAAFVESAILKCVDESSGPVNKINGSLEKLFATAGKLKNLKVDIRINTPRNLDSTVRGLDRIATALGRVSSANLSGVSNVAGHLGALQRALNTPISTRGITTALNRLNGLSLPNLGNLASQIRQVAGAIHSLNNAQGAQQRWRPPQMPPVPPGGGSGRGPRDYGWFGRFPENIPGIAARYAGYRTVQYTHDMARTGGEGIRLGNDQRVIDMMQNLPQADVADNWRVARAASDKYQSMSVPDAVEIARQARVQTQDPSRLNEIVEAAGKLQTMATAVFGDAKKGADTAYKVMRVGIASGKIEDPSKFAAMTDEIGRAILQAGKDVSPQLIESTFRQAGSLVKMGASGQMIGDLVNLSDEERGRAADRIRSFTQDLMRPNLADKNAERMQAAGLRGKDNVAVDSGLLASDAFRWTQKHVLPKLQAQNVDLTSADAIQNALYKMGFHSSSAQYASMAILKRKEIEQEREARAKFNTDPSFLSGLQFKHYRTAQAAIEKQFQNFTDAIAAKHEATIAPMFGGAAGLLNYASKNPGTAVGALAGVAGAGAYGAYQLGSAMMQHPGLTAAGALHMAAAKALMGAAAALRGGALVGAGTRATAAGAMGKAAWLGLPGAAGAATAAPGAGMLARMRASWGGMGMMGKGLTGLGAASGIWSLVNGEYASGLGMLALTAGSLAGGPVGMTIAALGGLVAAWPILKALLGASKADAAEVKKGASDATDASKDATDAMRKHVDEMQREQAARDDARNAARQALRRPMEQFGPPPPDQVSPLLDKIDAQIRLWIEKINNLGKHKLEAAEVKEDQAASDRRQNPRREGESEAGYRRRLALEDMARVAAEREHNDWLRQNGVTPPRDRNESDADGITAGQRADQAARENANKRLDAMINGWGFNTPPAQPKEPPAFWDWFQNQQMTPQVPGGGLLEWLKGLNPFGGKPDQMGQAQGGEDMRAAFSDGASQVSAAGQAAGAAISGGAQSLVGAGQAASAGWYGQLVAAGSALGAAAAAQISAAHVNVQVNASGGGPNVGNNTGVTKPSAQ